MTFNWTCNADCTWFECEPGDGWRLKIARYSGGVVWKWEVYNDVTGQTIRRDFTDNLSDAFAEVQLAYMRRKDTTP